MSELDDNSVDLIITSPPYFNIKDYSKSGNNHAEDIGAIDSYKDFIAKLLVVWQKTLKKDLPMVVVCYKGNGDSYELERLIEW